MLSERNQIAIIADDETILGFSLTGLENKKENPLFFSVDDNTTEDKMISIYRGLLARPDVAIIFVNQLVMRKIRNIINEDRELLPTVMEIPGKTKNN